MGRGDRIRQSRLRLSLLHPLNVKRVLGSRTISQSPVIAWTASTSTEVAPTVSIFPLPSGPAAVGPHGRRAGQASAGNSGTCGIGHALFLSSLADATASVVHPLTLNTDNTIAIGKYLVSPLSKRLADGQYAASVSIRSGRGSASTDRVMRFKGSFFTEGAAQRYACEQGIVWVSESRGAMIGAGARHLPLTP